MSPSFRNEDLARDLTDVDSAVAVAVKTGAALATPIMDRHSAAVVVPDGFRVEVLDPEANAPNPARKRGQVNVFDLDALIGYVNDHAIDGHTALFVDPRAPRVTAVINDHGKGDADDNAAWGDHRAVLDLVHPPEWKFWIDADDELMSQIEFAQMVEDGQKDIIDPDPATMLEVARTFEAQTKAQFSKATRLDNGQVQVAYHEEINAAAGTSGQLEIPATFTLALPVFEGGPRYPVTARVRYRCSGGQLRLGYRLERLADVLRFAIQGDDEDAIIPKLRKECGAAGATVYLGQPRASRA